MYRELLTKRAFWKRANDEAYQPTAEEVNSFADAVNGNILGEFEPESESRQQAPTPAQRLQATTDGHGAAGADAEILKTINGGTVPGYQHTPMDMTEHELNAVEQLANDESLPLDQRKFWAEQARTMRRGTLLNFLGDKNNYGALAALSAAGLGGLGGAAFGGNANERILNAITGAAGGAGAVGGARGAMELLEGNVDPLLAAGLGGVTGGIGSGALARLLAKTLMK